MDNFVIGTMQENIKMLSNSIQLLTTDKVIVKANWTETDEASDSYILNKPANAAGGGNISTTHLAPLVSPEFTGAPTINGTNITLTEKNFTTELESKLAGIASGADVTPSWVPDSNPNYVGANLVKVAVGYLAGSVTQGTKSVAVGNEAGKTTQGTKSVAVGNEAGKTTQGQNSVAVGHFAGHTGQETWSVAVGDRAGSDTQGHGSVAVGSFSGQTTQGTMSVAVGNFAGQTTQGANSVATGNEAGQTTQGTKSVAVGNEAGKTTQGTYSVAVGNQAGETDQKAYTVAVGNYAGNDTQGTMSVAVGNSAGQTTQGTYSIAMGYYAGNSTQGANSVAVGNLASSVSQGTMSVAVGNQAGALEQGDNSVATGSFAGQTRQGTKSVAVGNFAGKTSQAAETVAVGSNAGQTDQKAYTVAVGSFAGNVTQGTKSVAVGNEAGKTTQGTYSVAVGNEAGKTDLGDYSIAIGNKASQAGGDYASTLVLNATGYPLDPEGADGTYISPIASGLATNILYYNETSKQVTKGAVPGGGSDVLSLKLNQLWTLTAFTYPWQPGSRLGPEFSSNPYDIIGTAPSSLSIGENYLITANTDGIYKFEISAYYRWYHGCTFNKTSWTCIRNGYTLAGLTSASHDQPGYDIVHSTTFLANSAGPPWDWTFPEHFLFTIQMYAGDRIMHGHYRNVEAASCSDGGQWPYTVSVTKVG